MVIDADKFEREWRKLERRRLWWELWFPLLIVFSVAFGLAAISYTKIGAIVAAIASAAGMPLMMWLNKRPKQ